MLLDSGQIYKEASFDIKQKLVGLIFNRKNGFLKMINIKPLK